MIVTEAASAKVNLFLHVGERRTDGFHPLQSLAVFTGANIRIGHLFRGCHLNWFRQALADLRRADRGQCADLAFAFALQESTERTQARQRAHQRASADIIGAAGRHEGAHVGGLDGGELLEGHEAAPMLAQEDEALAEVARIGFQRLGR